MSDNHTRKSLLEFLHRYQDNFQSQFRNNASVEFDPDWRSPCEIDQPDSAQRIRWSATVEQRNTSFAGLEQALETTLHPSIVAYYTSVWFPGVGATATDGDLELIGVWNSDDFENLQANIIGHVLQQRRAQVPLTVFFAVTLPDSEYCLSVDNSNGNVLLERAGSGAERVVSTNLADFLDALEPRF